MNKRKLLIAQLACLCGTGLWAQQVKFSEYNLPNGLHVILSPDSKAPVVTVSVMYHVGSKNEDTARTGFAHFFEHLLFEGSDNIKRGEFMKIVSSNGGQNNANTSQDRTFYFENFPSNQLALGLWLESERMMHPVINQIGVKTQNEVVKEEKRQSLDNRPYGQFNHCFICRSFHDASLPVANYWHYGTLKCGHLGRVSSLQQKVLCAKQCRIGSSRRYRIGKNKETNL